MPEATATQGPPVPAKPCVHNSMRLDGTLNTICLRCGVSGYWHDGHRHDVAHPSGKVLVRLDCADCEGRHELRPADVEVGDVLLLTQPGHYTVLGVEQVYLGHTVNRDAQGQIIRPSLPGPTIEDEGYTAFKFYVQAPGGDPQYVVRGSWEEGFRVE